MTLAASILASDFGRLREHAAQALDAGADWLHVDVMDGHFVPNITIGPLIVEALQPLRETHPDVPFDVHLMIESPERYVEAFARAGASRLTVHVETCPHLHRTVELIHESGLQAGVALNPATPLVLVEEILPYADLLLVMSVNPGFGGQQYVPTSTAKLRRARRMIDAGGRGVLLQVDGGVSPRNVRAVVDAGTDVVVAGSAIFRGDVAANVRAFRDALQIVA